MDYRIWLSPPHLSGNELKYIENAIRSNHLAYFGANVDLFKSQLTNYLKVNTEHIALTSSGTSALHLALRTLNIGTGDYVICQSNSFVATANSILYVNATPIFIDSEPHSWNMCPDLLEEALVDLDKRGIHPKAIITTDLYGMPYDVQRINKLSEQFQIPVVEDSAEALGSKYGQLNCGTLGSIGVFSFNSNKIVTTSGGGALISRDPQLIKKVNYYANQAKSERPYYWHEEVGYNYKFSNVLAGIGVAQMKSVENYIEKRRAVFKYYSEKLCKDDTLGIMAQFEPQSSQSNRWLSCFTFKNNTDKEKVRKALLSHRIEARNLWKPLHTQPLFKQHIKFLNGVSEDLFDRGLCLPSGSNLSQNNLEEIVELIHKHLL